MKKFWKPPFQLNEKAKKLILTMKLTVFILFLTLMQVSATVYSQATKFSFRAQNKQVVEVLRQIEENSDFRFFFLREQVDVERKVTVTAREATVEQILEELFRGEPVSYEFANEALIVLTRSDNPLGSVSNYLQGNMQQPAVTGAVTDESGQPLPGVTVLVKGTTQGTVTNSDGNYSLTNIPEDAILVFSFVGMQTQELEVGGQSTIDVTMEIDAIGIEEVVAVGYGTQKKINLTGAISQVKGEDFIEDRPVLNVGQALQGVVPGLTVSKSNGKPGVGYSFNIRGTTSLNGGSPLVLVDGTEMNPNLVPPEDIESVSVLKDAASAAIYGARAAFGVVLITTKSGKKNSKIKISYSNNFSWTNPTVIPEKVDPVTQIRVGNIAWANAGGNPDMYWGKNANTWIGLYEAPDYVPNSIKVIDGIAYPLGNTNMIEEMTEAGFTNKHNLSFSGGSDRTTYYINAGLMKQEGVLVLDKDKYSRSNIISKVDSDITDWMSIGVTIGYTKTQQDFPWIPQGEQYLYNVSYQRPNWWLTGTDEVSGAPWGYSPVMVDLGAINTNIADNTNIHLRSSLEPFKGFKIIGNYTHRRITTDNHFHANIYEMANPPSGPGITWKSVNPNSLERTASFSSFENMDLYGEYVKTFEDQHNLKLMIGYSQEEYSYKRYNAKKEELISDNIPSLSLATGNSYVSDGITEWSTRSGFYRFNYDYKEKYLIEAVGRYDGSSKFNKDNRFVFSPSFAVGWVVNKESFMNWSENWLDLFKIRTSYGVQGNQSVGAYSYMPTMTTGYGNWIVSGMRPIVIGAAGLVSDSYTWEQVKTYNFGADFGFFNSRLAATAEVYQRETIGMLLPGEVLPALLGTSVPRENAADLKVNGWEISLDWRDRLSSGFSYRAGLRIYDNKTIITDYANPSNYLGEYYVGKVLGEIWGYETDRLFQEEDFIIDENGNRNYAQGIPTQDIIFQNRIPYPGDVKYKDLNNDGEVNYGEKWTLDDHGDYTKIGNTSSRYQYGINLGANYKNFDLSVFLQGVAKKDIWTNNSFAFTPGSFESAFVHTLDYWTPENTDAFYPRPDTRNYNRQPQSKYLLNAAYMRLKTVTLGYSLPSALTSRLKIDNCKIFFTGENLFIISGLPRGLDPELGASYTFPLAKDFSFGISVTL